MAPPRDGRTAYGAGRTNNAGDDPTLKTNSRPNVSCASVNGTVPPSSPQSGIGPCASSAQRSGTAESDAGGESCGAYRARTWTVQVWSQRAIRWDVGGESTSGSSGGGTGRKTTTRPFSSATPIAVGPSAGSTSRTAPAAGRRASGSTSSVRTTAIPGGTGRDGAEKSGTPEIGSPPGGDVGQAWVSR